jgi:hypothetical protein
MIKENDLLDCMVYRINEEYYIMVFKVRFYKIQKLILKNKTKLNFVRVYRESFQNQ